MDQTTKDQIWSHLNVLLLMLLFVLGGIMLARTYHNYPDHANFVEQMVGQILAGLLAMLTGARIANGRAGDAQNAPKPPDDPNPSPTTPNAPEGQPTPPGGN